MERNMSQGQFYRRARADISLVDKTVERESAVRVYCWQRGSAWSFQVRAPLTLRNGREGKDFIVATAYLEREQMQTLRDSIDRFLADEDQPDVADETKVAP